MDRHLSLWKYVFIFWLVVVAHSMYLHTCQVTNTYCLLFPHSQHYLLLHFYMFIQLDIEMLKYLHIWILYLDTLLLYLDFWDIS